MRIIKNFDELAATKDRKICLEIIEAGLSSIQPEKIIAENISLTNSILTIQDKTINLQEFERIFLLGFGKGSARLAKIIENLLGDFLTEGYVIDLADEQFNKIKFTKGTHPLPSQENFSFTQNVISKFSNLTQKDLVLVIICGGGSSMLIHPHNITLEEKIKVDRALLRSGADITEMNTVRQHLSDVKGGSLAKILYPSTVVSLISSDIPGNNISYIASGPTAKDNTVINDAINILKKYNLEKELNLSHDAFVENPKEDKYFERVENIIILSNKTALNAMQKKAQELGLTPRIYSDKFESGADDAGKILINETAHNEILLAGGETTVKVMDKNGKGGRNQELVLAALPYLNSHVTIASFDSDGWDNTEFAGAIGDVLTSQKAENLGINPKDFLEHNNSFPFFDKIKGGIVTGRLPSNVSDLMVVIKT
ncbi:MAG: DUF4147 domain-containing protein [Patescibacteria group bacterium]